MLRWGKGGDRRDEEEPQPAAEEGADDWAFLRAQPDHDADEMSAVRSDPAPSDQPQEKAGDDWAFLRTQPDHDTEEMQGVRPDPAALGQTGAGSGAAWAFLLDQPDHDADKTAAIRPELASPDPVESAPAIARTSPTAPTAARPAQDLVRDRPAFEDESPVKSDGDGAPRLVLKVTLAGRSWMVAVEETSLIGRSDPEIGLHAAIDLAEDSEVARCHALLRLREERFYLVDLASAAGVIRNGERLIPDREVPLAPGDQIELGRLVQLSVIACDADPELTEEDLLLADMAGEMLEAGEAAPPEEDLNGGDILDIALERGRAAGLLPPERPGEPK